MWVKILVKMKVKTWEVKADKNHRPKQSATDELKTSWKRFIQKTAEATGDLIGNKISN